MATSSSTTISPRRHESISKWRSGQPPAFALLVYPITLLVGSLYSAISPTAQSQQQSTATRPGPVVPINYFARKDNIFNIYFVKVGWAWTTLAFASLLFTQQAYTHSPVELRAKRGIKALLRYAVVTCAWFLTTQWFFGPAIIDRMFTLSGGRCENISILADSPSASSSAAAGTAHKVTEEIKTIFTAAACKAAAGHWKGGHDVSGHVFMLVLASAFLAVEALGTSSGECKPLADGAKEKQDNINTMDHSAVADIDDRFKVWSLRFVWGVALLSWWMLLMTAIWFHTWLEKLSGLLIAISVIYIIYYLPRTLTSWRHVIGIPGI